MHRGIDEFIRHHLHLHYKSHAIYKYILNSSFTLPASLLFVLDLILTRKYSVNYIMIFYFRNQFLCYALSTIIVLLRVFKRETSLQAVINAHRILWRLRGSIYYLETHTLLAWICVANKTACVSTISWIIRNFRKIDSQDGTRTKLDSLNYVIFVTAKNFISWRSFVLKLLQKI